MAVCDTATGITGTIRRKVQEIPPGRQHDRDVHEWIEAGEPVILKGIFADRPLVQAGRRSAALAMAHVQQFYNGRPVVVYSGPSDIGGRFFYNSDLNGFNFSASRMPLGDFFALLDNSPSDVHYMGSTGLDGYFPGLRAADRLDLPGETVKHLDPLVSLWAGNRTVVAAHFDMSHNAACCMVGRRRFVLFPPDQIDNLYPGPLAPTPAGQVVSMVDFANPDFDRHPRFKKALEAGWIAELAAGDMLVYPALWWHQVEALDSFNVLLNFWWNCVPDFVDSPMNTLLHGLLSLRARPADEKRAWRALFDYYLFAPPDRACTHLPEAARGPLGSMDADCARRLRGELLKKLNR